MVDVVVRENVKDRNAAETNGRNTSRCVTADVLFGADDALVLSGCPVPDMLTIKTPHGQVAELMQEQIRGSFGANIWIGRKRTGKYQVTGRKNPKRRLFPLDLYLPYLPFSLPAAHRYRKTDFVDKTDMTLISRECRSPCLQAIGLPQDRGTVSTYLATSDLRSSSNSDRTMLPGTWAQCMKRLCTEYKSCLSSNSLTGSSGGLCLKYCSR